MANEPFYRDGLRFSCTRCSRCCRHQPGYVFLSEKDLLELAEEKSTSRDEVVSLYCRQVNINGFFRLSLKEKANFDCVFWERGRCTVHEHRPLQCRNYPFWHGNLESIETWNELQKECPGVNIGKLHVRNEIEEILEKRRSQPLIEVLPGKKPGTRAD
ncbi:MAG TPA: YkgJ family cysteine cluster protein [Spirochaetia bacterium]|nr:YkgJ family cysteine cluster protein [Spirochaetia bacterium]